MLNAKSIDIFCHSAPDEDTLNSAQTLALWLKPLGKEIRIIIEGNSTKLFLKNPEIKNCIVNPAGTEQLAPANLAVVVDCNATSRIPKKGAEFLKRYSKIDIIGFDHHNPEDRSLLVGNPDINSDNPFYIDATAKSCSSIIFRFFEGLGIKLTQAQLENLYCGMIDDFSKSNLVKLVSKDGMNIVEKTDEIKKFPTSSEVLDKIEKQLPPALRNKILDHLDILNHLTFEEKAFQEKLFKKVKFSENGNLAYIIIPPEDREWINLEQDTNINSTILSNARQRLLENRPDDKLIPDEIRDKLSKVKGVIIFYRGEKNADPTKDIYKMSINSIDDYAKRLIEFIKANLYPQLKAGGHSNRSGGRINSTKPERCNQFIEYFLQAAEIID